MEDRLKKILRAISLETRHILEGQNGEAGDLEQQLNRLGIWRNRSKPIEEMPQLSPEDREARRVVDAYLDFRQEAGVKREDAVAEFIRESAYTWANRLFALRIMEARGIIDEVILKKEVYGGRSLVHSRLAKKNPEASRGEDDGLFAMLFKEFQERSRDLSDLFNPESAATRLRPSVAALKRIIALLSGLEKSSGQEAAFDEIFEAPDAFGWMYQYWNQEEKAMVFEKLRTIKRFKIQGSDVIPSTQLYTEPYMVKFLVQNSLGAIWMNMHPNSMLFEKWEYYVRDADHAPAEMKPVSELTFMDPASGSGHFHIEAFDLFYDMYEEEGILVDSKDICASILNKNLFGIDIDERAVQISKAILWMKALERAPDLDGSLLKQFHDHLIATNIRLPKATDNLELFLLKYPDDVPLRPALESIFNGLENVDELGSLIQIEEPVDKALRDLKGSLLLFCKDTGWDIWKRGVLARLKEHFADEMKQTNLKQLFFSKSVGEGLALFHLLARRYDVIATNPPYLGSRNMGALLKSTLLKDYTEGKSDLFGAFMLLCWRLCNRSGLLAMVTPQSWMFLKQFSGLRANPKGEFDGFLRAASIDMLAHLGPGAFEEISGEIVNTVLLVFSKTTPSTEHKLIAYRITGGKSSSEKDLALRNAILEPNLPYVFKVKQDNFNNINNSPICYWLPQKFFDLLRSEIYLNKYCKISEGAGTRNESRFLRMTWECPSILLGKRWISYCKGGGYRKWDGLTQYRIDWDINGTKIKLSIAEKFPYLNGNVGILIRDPELYLSSCLTYSAVASGSLSVRVSDKSICSDQGPGIYTDSTRAFYGIAGLLNTRIASYFCRALSANPMYLGKGYLYYLPIPADFSKLDDFIKMIEYAIDLKSLINNDDILEHTFIPNHFSTLNGNRSRSNLIDYVNNYFLEGLRSIAVLLFVEGVIEQYAQKLYEISPNDMYAVIEETSTPAGWLHFIENFEDIKGLLNKEDPFLMVGPLIIENSKKLKPSAEETKIIKHRLSLLYQAGPKAKEEFEETTDLDDNTSQDEQQDVTISGRTIPSETFLEDISQKIEINPISVYYLLKEGIEKNGWHCISEEQRITKDKFTVIVLRLLGHRWPKQIEANEPLPDWADKDGIIPLTEGCGEKTLLERVRERIAEEFPGGRVQDIEREFEEIMETSLEKWLAGPFFKHHISQFKKRPIAWQIESKPPNGGGKGRKARQAPVFSCLVYYHKLDGDLLHKIRTQYVWNLRDRFQTELRTLENMDSPSNDQLERLGKLRRRIEELKDFDARLEQVSLNGFDCTKLKEIVDQEPLDKWTSRDGQAAPPATREEFYLQEKRYDPDINDGVRVNIAPLQIAGLLSADVLAKKDLEKAIQDRAEWRADERRWCRQGKLPRPGWWKEDGQ